MRHTAAATLRVRIPSGYRLKEVAVAKNQAKPPTGQARKESGKFSQVRVSNSPLTRTPGPPPTTPRFDGPVTNTQAEPSPPNESGTG